MALIKKSDMQINERFNITMFDIQSLTNMPKMHTEEKNASSTNGDWKTGCPHIDEWNLIHIYRFVQN